MDQLLFRGLIFSFPCSATVVYFGCRLWLLCKGAAVQAKIVIADDESIIRMNIREILEMAGYEVAGEAADGLDAVELCRTEKPDLALLDIKMPLMDGLSAAEAIHRESSRTAIIMLTAYGDSGLVDKAADIGVMGYLVKPIDEKTMIATISVALKRREEMNRLEDTVDAQTKQIAERKLIEKAKGIIMKTNGISEEEAYDYLRSVSMDKRMAMAEVARTIIRSYELIGGAGRGENR